MLGDAKALHQKLGKPDQQKLAEYLGSVRQTEEPVQRLVSWVDVPKPQVASTDLQLGSKPQDAHDRLMWLDVMLELSYLSFVTDTTRVIAFEWSRKAGCFGGGGENQHELSHHSGDKGMLEGLAKIDQFHVALLARFLTFRKSNEEAGGHILESTMVLYGSGINSGLGGEHSPKNLPTLVVGGTKLGLKHGQHPAHDPNSHPRSSTCSSRSCKKMGVETAKFQDAHGPRVVTTNVETTHQVAAAGAGRHYRRILTD